MMYEGCRSSQGKLIDALLGDCRATSIVSMAITDDHGRCSRRNL